MPLFRVQRLYSASVVYFLDSLQNDETEAEMEADVDRHRMMLRMTEIDAEMEADVRFGWARDGTIYDQHPTLMPRLKRSKGKEDVASTNEAAIEALEKAVLDQKKDLVFLEFEAEDDALGVREFRARTSKARCCFQGRD